MATVNAAELARWTPISIHLDDPTPSIDWADLGDLRFMDPFFDDTVERWAKGTPTPRTVNTNLDALTVLDQAPSLDPSGMIFHMSRCGSTLATRLLQQVPGCVVVSEAASINSVLQADAAIIDDETRARLLRLLIRALGRRRFGDERHFVLKLTSWNVCQLDVFRRAFPATPLVWLQREPADVIASLLARPPEWRTDKPVGHAATLESAEFYVRAVARLLQAACGAFPGTMSTVDYSALPEAVWTTIAPLFGWAPSPDDIALMVAQARYYSKDVDRRLYERPPERATASSRSIAGLGAEALDPLYREL
ncbi:MAG: sulfotransferase, partial [Bauldia sp.]